MPSPVNHSACLGNARLLTRAVPFPGTTVEAARPFRTATVGKRLPPMPALSAGKLRLYECPSPRERYV